jgi:hypothetical protein
LPSIIDDILGGNHLLDEDRIWELSGLLQDRYRGDKNVIESSADRLIFVGDLHGELEYALRVKDLMNSYGGHLFVFLGDYGDRGPKQTQTFNLVSALALKHPKDVLMLRGNHETASVAARYGFYHQVVRDYSQSAFKHYTSAFSVLPMAVRTDKGVFGCHGGIPEGVRSVEEIDACRRYGEELEDDVLLELVWNDPREGDFRFRHSPRGGGSKLFGGKAFSQFCRDLSVQLMVRAHEVVSEGVRTLFDGQLFSVFTSSYGGRVKPKVLRVGPTLETESIPL